MALRRRSLKDAERVSPKNVDLESLLVTEVGQFGWYQWRVLALSALVSALSALSSNEFVFTAARINTRCLIPECESPSSRPVFAPTWILNAVPATSAGFDACHRFTNATMSSVNDETCPASLFDRQSTIRVRSGLRRVASLDDRHSSHHRHAGRAGAHRVRLGPLGPPHRSRLQLLQHRLDGHPAILRQHIRRLRHVRVH